ncbi:hypothetical protein DFP72DRAFT_898671 [Ephemerocybe angulata]|uniref:MYND-type domain-containing protein n=1 Tax=Ephemerocybe angulata TaxID=980116 RepID=A0A8H6M6G4_9AGAR|nr:hypothetical protein DFP72DRAFT_898671 [Tulosesus angulatus]
MPSKETQEIETLLKHVRLGSRQHIQQLSQKWPIKYTIPAAAGVLSHLSREKLPRSAIEFEHLTLACLCFTGITKALGIPPARYLNPTETPLWVMIRDAIDGIGSWLILCTVVLANHHDHEVVQSIVLMTTSFFEKLLDVPELKHTLRSSSPMTAFVAFIWKFTSPQSGLPFYLVERSLQPSEAPDHPDTESEEQRLVSDGLHTIVRRYTEKSEEAKKQLLLRLSDDGTPRSGAREFVRIASERAQRMAQLCNPDNSTWISGNFIEAINMFTDTLGDFVSLEDPAFLEAFRSHRMLKRIMTVVHSFIRHLDLETKSANLMVARMAVQALQKWTAIPGVAVTTTKAVSQLIQGGLLSVYLTLLIHNHSIRGTFERSCRDLGQWIINYSFYPSVHAAIMVALSRIDQKQLLELFERNEDHWSRRQWVALSCPLFTLGRPGMQLLKGRGLGICDNLFHTDRADITPKKSDTERDSHFQACSGCHTVVYCSSLCQREDWERSRHRDDCTHLTKLYAQQMQTCSRLHSSTRLFQFAILQETYRRCMKDGVPDVIRRQVIHRNREPLNQLVISFNFVDSTGPPENLPRLKSISELWEGLKEKGSNELGSFARALGLKRLEAMMDDFTKDNNIRLVEGRFKFRDQELYVLARLRIFRDEDGIETPEVATILGGTSANLG